MLRSRVLVSAVVAALAVLALGLAVGHRLGAAGTARPVVRQSFVVMLDPGSPDFVAGGVGANWRLMDFDDAAWAPAFVYGDGFGHEKRIWSSDNVQHDRVLFRRTFIATAADSGFIEVECDNAYRAYLNGHLLADQTQGSRVATSVADLLVDGENLLAVEGIDNGGTAYLAFTLIGSLGEIVSDAECRAYAPEAEDSRPLFGTGWARVSIPGLSRRSAPLFSWQTVSNASTSQIPELSDSWRVVPMEIPVVARDCEVLLQLTSGLVDAQRHLIAAGNYRLTVDLVE